MDSEDQEVCERMSRTEEVREQTRKGTHGEKRTGRGFGRLLSVLGILVALAGALTPSDVGPLGTAGVLLGALGFALGALRLGTAAVALSQAETLLGVLTSQELVQHGQLRIGDIASVNGEEGEQKVAS